jgi:hypothetical protein
LFRPVVAFLPVGCFPQRPRATNPNLAFPVFLLTMIPRKWSSASGIMGHCVVSAFLRAAFLSLMAFWPGCLRSLVPV